MGVREAEIFRVRLPGGLSGGERDWEPSRARPRMAARFTVWPLDSCRNSSSEMVSRSAGQPEALAALTCAQHQLGTSVTKNPIAVV